MQWLISSSAQERLDKAPTPTAEQLQTFLTSFAGPTAQTGTIVTPSAARVMTVAGGTAQIDVMGILTTAPDFMAAYFGGGNTLFGDIVQAIQTAEADESVDSVDFFFNSPGGEAMPTVGLADLIASMNKPTRSLVDSAQSASLWLATQADTVIANTRGSTFGSLGVVIGARKPSESTFAEVTSTNAPNKRPNPETAEGVTAIREQIDPMHEMFAKAVADARGTTVEDVNANYGRGGTLIAEKALEVGMIDEITAMPSRSTAPVDTNEPLAVQSTQTETEGNPMNLTELKAQEPALYAEVIALGVEQGVAKEQDRVKYHAKMGANTGATAFALEACLKGTGKDDGEAQAEYMTAGMNKRELDTRAEDDKELDANNPAPNAESARENAAVASIFKQAGCNATLNFKD